MAINKAAANLLSISFIAYNPIVLATDQACTRVEGGGGWHISMATGLLLSYDVTWEHFIAPLECLLELRNQNTSAPLLHNYYTLVSPIPV